MSRQESAADVLFETRGRLGIITLNRPAAINALNTRMVEAITSVLQEWAHDVSVRTVLVQGAGDRGLCASGDIAALYQDATVGDLRSSAEFWRDEYRLNAYIAGYPKPFVAYMDGIVLGGGIGISAHGSHRIVTEGSSLGLPETGIGFIPDVGSTWLLAGAPGELGTSLALTAGTARAGDAIAVGLADFFVSRDRLDHLTAVLAHTEADEAISAFGEEAPSSELLARQDWIDGAFAPDTIPEILGRLAALGTPEATRTAEKINANSPTALAVALESLRRARALGSLEETLQQEFRVSLHSLRTADFVEGIRAQIIDKDRRPRWAPADHDEVTRSSIEAFFAPLADDDRLFPRQSTGEQAIATTQERARA